MCKWTNDSQRFLLEHFDTICGSPSHIYHSALPFSPSSSWFHEHYSAELLQEVKVVKGLPARWGTCSRTVSLNSHTLDLSCWNNTLAVGTTHGDIIIFDAITGSQTDILSGHIAEVKSLTFSSDGKSLLSGSDDCTAKLWDMQTGGVIKTFSGHTAGVLSVSISLDFTIIASGSEDKTIRLWNSQTGKCHCILEQQEIVWYISFHPTNSQYLLSIYNRTVWQWDIKSHKVGPIYEGSHIAFSSDGSQFVICNETSVTVKNTSSGVVIAEFQAANSDPRCCCFSPDNKLVAVATGATAYVWNIANSEPHCIETFIGHTMDISSLAFSSPSSLISVSYDQSVKFWQIGIPSDPIETDPKSTSLTSAAIRSITLQAKDDVVITSDSDGVVRTWDILTGHCKGSFKSPAKGFYKGDVQIINDKLIFVWFIYNKINIWDAEKGELLLAIDRPFGPGDLRISGDGSRIFFLDTKAIQALSIETGETVGKVEIGHSLNIGSLTVDGSRVWVYHPGSGYQGWDFGTSNSLPVQWKNMPILYLNDTLLWDISQFRIRDIATGKVVFQLSGRFANPVDVKCNGCFLAAGYKTGEILIIDINCLLLQ